MSFAWGVLVGFVTAILILLSLIWFFLLRSPSHRPDIDSSGLKRFTIVRRRRKQPQHVPSPAPLVQESCQWLNDFLARLVFDPLLADASLIKQLIGQLESKLNAVLPKQLGYLHLDDVRMGSRIPQITSIEHAGDSGQLQVCLDWKDAIGLSVSTAILLGNGTDVLAELPLSLDLRLLRLAIRLKVQTSNNSLLWSLEDDYAVDVQVGSEIGAECKLRDAPKVAQLVVQAIRQSLKRLVNQEQTLTLPAVSTVFQSFLEIN